MRKSSVPAQTGILPCATLRQSAMWGLLVFAVSAVSFMMPIHNCCYRCWNKQFLPQPTAKQLSRVSARKCYKALDETTTAKAKRHNFAFPTTKSQVRLAPPSNCRTCGHGNAARYWMRNEFELPMLTFHVLTIPDVPGNSPTFRARQPVHESDAVFQADGRSVPYGTNPPSSAGFVKTVKSAGLLDRRSTPPADLHTAHKVFSNLPGDACQSCARRAITGCNCYASNIVFIEIRSCETRVRILTLPPNVPPIMKLGHNVEGYFVVVDRPVRQPVIVCQGHVDRGLDRADLHWKQEATMPSVSMVVKSNETPQTSTHVLICFDILPEVTLENMEHCRSQVFALRCFHVPE